MGKPDQLQHQSPDQSRDQSQDQARDQSQDQAQRQPGKEHPTVADESRPQGPNDRSREADPGQDDAGNKPAVERDDRIGTPKDPRPIVESPQDDLA